MEINIKRYNMYVDIECDEEVVATEENKGGEWCKYEDVQELVKKTMNSIETTDPLGDLGCH